MILQSLVNYYEQLIQKGKISPPGWTNANVSFALNLDEDGELLGLLPLRQEAMRGKKKVEVPQSISVPEQVKKTTNVASNFLCDSPTYLLGIDLKERDNSNEAKRIKAAERAVKCFEACKALHERLLTDVDTPAARAILAFFNSWKPEGAAEHPKIKPHIKELDGMGGLLFYCCNQSVLEDSAICEAWDRHYQSDDPNGVQGRCLVTGGDGPPSIKKVAAALNYLLETLPGQRLGDTALVFWAEDTEEVYRDLFHLALFGGADKPEEKSKNDISNPLKEVDIFGMGMFGDMQTLAPVDMLTAIERLAEGEKIDLAGTIVDPFNKFYVLGLVPNVARLSVRFFWQGEFQTVMKNLKRRYEALQMVKPVYENGSI